MEFNNGLLAGMPFEEADKLYPAVPDLPAGQSVYGQDSALQFRRRADRVLECLRNDSSPEDVIALVSHGGMINQLYHSLLNLPVQDSARFVTGDAAFHVWQIDGERMRILSANVTQHTEGL